MKLKIENHSCNIFCSVQKPDLKTDKNKKPNHHKAEARIESVKIVYFFCFLFFFVVDRWSMALSVGNDCMLLSFGHLNSFKIEIKSASFIIIIIKYKKWYLDTYGFCGLILTGIYICITHKHHNNNNNKIIEY